MSGPELEVFRTCQLLAPDEWRQADFEAGLGRLLLYLRLVPKFFPASRARRP
jgi:hypothetical protein